MDATAADPDTSGRPAGPVWMTYPELAKHLGCTADAARQRANRGRWRRQRGNDGRPRVLVEPEVLSLAVPSRPTGHPVGHRSVDYALDRTPEGAAEIAALKAQIDFLKDALEHERSRAERERERADALIAKEIAGLRTMLEELRRDRDEWRRQPQALALTDQTKSGAPATVPSVALEPRRLWWRRLVRA
jgi:hypothetical protein